MQAAEFCPAVNNNGGERRHKPLKVTDGDSTSNNVQQSYSSVFVVMVRVANVSGPLGSAWDQSMSPDDLPDRQRVYAI